MSPFFGLHPEYRLGLHQEIFSMCYAGKGGFSFTEVYEMPIYLRRYYLKMMADAIEEERKQHENSSGKQISKPNINMPR
jgi:hypothetical protein